MPPPAPSELIDDARTEAFLVALDAEAIAQRGSVFLLDAPRIAEPDIPAAVEDAYAQVRGVDRHRVLSALFAQLTRDCATDDERLAAIARFLARGTLGRERLDLRTADGVPVRDPLVHLLLGGWLDATAACLGVDLFTAAGYRARLVISEGIVLAEVRYDDAWHHLEYAGYGGADPVVRLDGRVPSWRELLERPELLDRLPFGIHAGTHGRPRGLCTIDRSAELLAARGAPWFTRERDAVPLGYDRTFGWWDVTDAPLDLALPRRDVTPTTLPGAVWIRRARVRAEAGGAMAELEWTVADDEDGDLLGYRVYVSRHPRGWHFDRFHGSGSASRSASLPDGGGWDPAAFDAFTAEPPGHVIETAETTLELRWPADETRWVTVMPFDAHHEAVGRRRYPVSAELRLALSP